MNTIAKSKTEKKVEVESETIPPDISLRAALFEHGLSVLAMRYGLRAEPEVTLRRELERLRAMCDLPAHMVEEAIHRKTGEAKRVLYFLAMVSKTPRK